MTLVDESGPWAEGSDADRGVGFSARRFAGDTGAWEPALRDAVVHLYKRRFISKAQHGQHWDPLIRNIDEVRADLHNHNLELVVDRDREVMYKQQAPVEDGSPTLLRDVTYTLEETALLVALRVMSLDGTGSVVRVDREDLLDTLSEYRPAHVANEAGKERREGAAVDKMLSIGLLRRTDVEDAYAIDPVIDAILPYDTLRVLHDTLHAAADVAAGSDDAGETEQDGESAGLSGWDDA